MRRRRGSFIYSLTGIYRAIENSERAKRIRVAAVLTCATVVAIEVVAGAIILVVHALTAR